MKQTLIGQIDRILFESEGFFIAFLKTGEKISGTYFESDVENLKGSAIPFELESNLSKLGIKPDKLRFRG